MAIVTTPAQLAQAQEEINSVLDVLMTDLLVGDATPLEENCSEDSRHAILTNGLYNSTGWLRDLKDGTYSLVVQGLPQVYPHDLVPTVGEFLLDEATVMKAFRSTDRSTDA